MAIQIKFKVLDIHPETKSATVYYYTDELVAHVRQHQLARIENLKHANPALSEEEAAKYAEREYPGGSILNVTFFEDVMPTGQGLVDSITSRAPVEHLLHRTKIISSPPDMSEVQSLIGQEIPVPAVVRAPILPNPMLIIARTATPELVIPQTEL